MSDLNDMETRPPFPSAVLYGDPVAARWEQNGLFAAFHGYRSRRRRGFRGFIVRTGQVLNLLIGNLIGLVVMFGFAWLIGNCFGIILFLILVFLWRVIHFRYIYRRAARLPRYFESCLFIKSNTALRDDLIMVPKSSLEIGEAIVLERLQREWLGRILAFWIFILVGLGIATTWDSHFGWGDWALSLFVITAAWFWSPKVYFEQAIRTARSAVDDLASIHDPSAVNRTALTFSALSINFFYVPFLVLLICFEVAFIYLILHEGIRVLLIRFIGLSKPIDPALNYVEQLTQLIIGSLIVASIFFARRSGYQSKRVWETQATLSSVEATQWCYRLFETEES